VFNFIRIHLKPVSKTLSSSNKSITNVSYYLHNVVYFVLQSFFSSISVLCFVGVCNIYRLCAVTKGIRIKMLILFRSLFHEETEIGVVTQNAVIHCNLYYDRRLVGQSVLEWSTHLGLTTRFFVTVRHLRVYWCGALSLTRVRVCR
jgi:hypothetical protein